MNLSLDTILTNARELVSRLRRDDATADTAVSQAQYVQERILSMKQYGDDLAELNDISSHRPKTAILYNIQKENRLIKQLQKENEELKQLVIEHRSVLEKIMYKYRRDVQRLILMDKEETKAVNLFNASLAQDIQDKSSKIHEMATVMRRAVDIDDTNSASQEERINALLLENRGLKEILAVHENIQRPKQISTTISEPTAVKSTTSQTTNLTSQPNTSSSFSSSSSSSSSPSPPITSDLTTNIPFSQQDEHLLIIVMDVQWNNIQLLLSRANTGNDIGSALFWTKNLILISAGTVVITALVTFLAVVYRCSKQQKSAKNKAHSSELTSFSTNLINAKTPRPKEIKLFPIIPKLVQPASPSLILPSLENNEINGDTFTDTCSTAGSSSSSTAAATKKFRKKNLLERRGSNNSLTISIAPKHRPVNSPPADCPSDEYLLTATRKLTIDELHKHAQDARLLYHEFWTIPTNHLEKLRICGAGTKNRYGTIIANEHSRVKLPELPGDPLSSYINANYVNGYPNAPHGFIATQGPLTNTIIDFYRMIWQEHAPVIVMITRLFEKNKAKCERYIPDSQANQYGPFKVQVKSVSYQSDYEIRRLIIEFENETREVEHYWYTAWPDQSCPDIAQPLIGLVKNVEKSRTELTNMNKHSGPVIVHCSAGIGRTGCFIALSNGIKQLDKERTIDIVRILCDLRRDRGGMIQTNDQYQFVYQALSEYARTLQLSS